MTRSLACWRTLWPPTQLPGIFYYSCKKYARYACLEILHLIRSNSQHLAEIAVNAIFYAQDGTSVLCKYSSLSNGLQTTAAPIVPPLHGRRLHCNSSSECVTRYGNPDMACRDARCRLRRCTRDDRCPMGALCLNGVCVQVMEVRTRLS